jgi:hypothetical protein
MADEGEDGVKIALAVCGASDEQIDSIRREGFNGMRDLLILDNKEIADMMTAITRSPLIYVIRKAKTPTSLPFTTTEDEQIYLMSHRGAAYNEDIQMVFQLLTQMLSGTGAWTAKSGKGAYEKLRNYYDGPGQIKKQQGYARNILADTHYQSEKQFSFKSYVTKLSEAFKILKDYEVEKAERKKGDCLLDGIQSESQIIVTAKTNMRMSHEN